MNVFRNYVEHAERPKVRRWTSAATPNAQHRAASATRRGRPNKRVHQEKGQPENHEIVQSARRRRERLATRQKITKSACRKESARKNGRAAAVIRKARSCCAEERMQKRKHPKRLEELPDAARRASRPRHGAHKTFSRKPPKKVN